MLFLIGISSESLDFKYFYGYPFKAEKNKSFYKKIINFLKGDFNQCSLSPQIMALENWHELIIIPKKQKSRRFQSLFLWIVVAVAIVVLYMLRVSSLFQITLSLTCGLRWTKTRRTCTSYWPWVHYFSMMDQNWSLDNTFMYCISFLHSEFIDCRDIFVNLVILEILEKWNT